MSVGGQRNARHRLLLLVSLLCLLALSSTLVAEANRDFGPAFTRQVRIYFVYSTLASCTHELQHSDTIKSKHNPMRFVLE